jgi:hypothetical protein
MLMPPHWTAAVILVLCAATAGCRAEASRITRTDPVGYQTTTFDDDALDRREFTVAIRAGIRDFDDRLLVLRSEAEALGPDSREKFHGEIDQLHDRRAEFAAAFERHGAMLDEQWVEHRETVAELYLDLREALDDTFGEVAEQGRA